MAAGAAGRGGGRHGGSPGGTRGPPNAAPPRRAAVAAGASYVGVGPCFSTTTKAGLPPAIGPAGIARVAAAVEVPVVAIGGIGAAEVAALDRGDVAYLQLCDAPAAPPPGMALRAESLTARLYPGEGELPLFALMDALPEDVVIDVETPVMRDRGLPAPARAALAGAAAKRFLAAWRAKKYI